MNGYTRVAGKDQNGQSIKKYTNQQQCKRDCNSNPNCKGIVTNGNNCWTIKGFPSLYSKSGSTTYIKNINGYNIIEGKDQDKQSIKKYTNNNNQCIKDCSLNNNCQGTVTNGSDCWTIKSFPNQYNKNGSITYKKTPPTAKINDYTTIIGKDQRGQTIQNYINDTKKCNTACNSNPNCKGMVINGSNCSTIKGFNEYSNPGSTTYKKIVYPTPILTSSNFPTSSSNNLFSSVFCKNISTNNGIIQKNNSGLSNLPVYKTEKAINENECLNKCNSDGYCSSYSFLKKKNDSNCLLYNKVPTNLNNDNNINSGYKINNYKYNFNSLNNSQKNIVRKDCLNNYFNKNNTTTNLDYSKCYKIENNNSKLSFDAKCLANMYEPLNKVKVLNNYNNIDTNLINSTTNEELNNFTQNYDGYIQAQLAILNSTNNNKNNISNYNQNINQSTNVASNATQNTQLQQVNATTTSILQSVTGTNDVNNVNESFQNYNIESNNVESNNIIKFYLFIFIVIIFLFLIYYLKKNKYF
jgi:hypothetical protein